jgi:mxaA protein
MRSRGISCRAEAAATALLLVCGCACAQVVQLRELEPRRFGYQLGDLVERRADVVLPAGLRLDEASLPVPRPGGSLELREVRWAPPPWWRRGGAHHLLLRYQVLRSPPAPQLLDLPPVTLRFIGATPPQQVRLDGVPILVNPLVPQPPPERRGLGALQPDSPPLPMATAPLRSRLAAEALVAVLAGGILAWRALGPRWRRQAQPFETAWRQVHRLPEPASAAHWRQALTALHQALDRSAGEALFAPGLDAFLARRPAYAPLRPELERFFELSRRTFFAPGGEAIPELGWLKALCGRARVLEREGA